jgi:AraC family transcriptional activator of pobA
LTVKSSAIPSFFLFGEAPRAVSDRFLHLEALDDRSRPNHWNIRAHAHADLHHIFLIRQGGGMMNADAATLDFGADALLIVPAGVVHGFVFAPETTGMVLTLADSYLRELALRESGFGALFARPAILLPSVPEAVGDSFARLKRELAWAAPGHAAAVESHLLAVLVESLRLNHEAQALTPSRDLSGAGLVARFREAVEAGFLSGLDIGAYARRLGVSATRLRRACRAVTGKAPIAIVRDRLILEAKRQLIYSDMTAAATAYYLGFEDPAYFSRVFRRAAGCSPGAFRKHTRLEATRLNPLATRRRA